MAFTQESVNQLVQQAAAQAGGTLSYADASNAARNLGISDAMFQGALSTGLITGAPAPATPVAVTPAPVVQAPTTAALSLPQNAAPIITGTPTGIPSLIGNVASAANVHLARPSIKEFMDATGVDFNTASNTLYGNIGANLDTRNWSAIMASSNPAEAARQATAQMYSDPAYREANTRHVVSQGYTPQGAASTYDQVLARVGAPVVAAKPLYQSLTSASTPAQIAAAYKQLAEGAGGDTAYNQQEAVAYLQKLGVPDSVIRSGYETYKGLGAASPATTTPPAPATEPLYKSLTANSTADDIARAYYQLTSAAGGDTPENQKEAVAYLQKLGISDPLIQSGYKDYREMVDLKSKFGATDGAAPTTEGIISGFKYANDSGITENDMKQVLGEDVFNTYKTGLADYAKTGIAGILADNKLSFDEAVETVKFGRALGYDTQKLADLTGTNKKVFDAIYKNYEETVPKVIASAIKESPDVKSADDQIVRALALGQKYGFSDDDFAKALGFTTAQVKSALDPVRNYGTEINKVLNNTDSTLADTKKIIESGRSNGAINKLYGTNLDTLDTKIAEIENRWKGFENVEPMHAQRVYDQISQQRNKLGGQYYRGVFGDPEIMAATLARKGIDTLADIGQKDKFETMPAEKRFFTEDGMQVFDLGNGTFGVPDAEGGAAFTVPKSQVKTEYGRLENVPRLGQDGEYYESKFVPISEKDVDKDGNYQQLVGKVAIDKDTGKEIADVDGQIAGQNSGGGLRKKWNTLNVQFTKDGVPVVYSKQEKAGLGALVQDLAPMISMALPFILPGVGSALSSSLAGIGGSSLASGTLLNQALTQGIIGGGLTTLGGGQFEKGFIGGAVAPVISTGISSMLPTGIDKTLAKTLTTAGTGAVRGALQGGDFKDILAGGITSGLADYGVNTALGASGLTPQQLNFATGIVAPLLQGNKITPATAFGTLVNAGQQMQRTAR